MTEDVKDKNEERQVGAEGVMEPGVSLTLKER